MPPHIHSTFAEIKVHTAKCDTCNKHNSSVMYRCIDCGQQCCTSCWNKQGGDNQHVLNSGSTIVLAAKAAVKERKAKKEKKRSRTKYIIVDEDDEDDDMWNEVTNLQMTRTRAPVKSTPTKLASPTAPTDASAGIPSAATLAAAELLLFHARAVSSSPSVRSSRTDDDGGIFQILSAAAELERPRTVSPELQLSIPNSTNGSDGEVSCQHDTEMHDPDAAEEPKNFIDLEMLDTSEVAGDQSSPTPKRVRENKLPKSSNHGSRANPTAAAGKRVQKRKGSRLIEDFFTTKCRSKKSDANLSLAKHEVSNGETREETNHSDSEIEFLSARKLSKEERNPDYNRAMVGNRVVAYKEVREKKNVKVEDNIAGAESNEKSGSKSSKGHFRKGIAYVKKPEPKHHFKKGAARVKKPEAKSKAPKVLKGPRNISWT